MNFEEFTWFNQQLAAMLREGLPIAGALKQLTQTQRDGSLREEFQRVETALASGVPLDRAVVGGNLPPLYVRLVQAGVQSGDLAGALTMAADYYAELNGIWRRAKTLLLYPVIVSAVGLGLSLVLWRVFGYLKGTFLDLGALGARVGSEANVAVLLVPFLFGSLVVALSLALFVSPFRQWLVWQLPGFREARTASFAGGLSLMLRQGCSLPESLALMQELERKSPAGGDIAGWQRQLELGQADLTAGASNWEVLPTMLAWFMRSAGGNQSEGFRRASQFYRERAIHQLDLMLHGALPILLVFLGLTVCGQLFMIFRLIIPMIDMLGAE